MHVRLIGSRFQSALTDGGEGGAPAGGENPQGGGEGGSDFRSLIPEEYREHPALQPYKDIGGLVKSHVEQQKLIGADKILKPQESWTDEDWGKFFNQIGRPDKPEAYGLEYEFPEDVQPNEEAQKKILDMFHQAGLTKKQAQTLYKQYNDFVVGEFTAQQEAAKKTRETAVNELKNDWGDDFQTRVDIASRAFKKFASEDQVKYIEESGLGNDPVLVKMFYEIGQKMAEASPDTGGTGGSGFGGATPESARAEIERLRNDQGFMEQYLRPEHPNHHMAVERYNTLAAKAYPGYVQPQ
jgi:hypothetical protein